VPIKRNKIFRLNCWPTTVYDFPPLVLEKGGKIRLLLDASGPQLTKLPVDNKG
jgi:hypothetical protein